MIYEDIKTNSIPVWQLIIWCIYLVAYLFIGQSIGGQIFIATPLILILLLSLSCIIVFYLKKIWPVGLGDYFLIWGTIILSPKDIPMFLIMSGLVAVLFGMFLKNKYIPFAPAILISICVIFFLNQIGFC
jgi:hypothetical protein